MFICEMEKSRVGIRKITIIYFFVLIVVISLFVFTAGLYLCVFHFGLSMISTDWANFGSFFNGLLSPILTAINIFVFIGISYNLSTLDDKRTENMIAGQRSITLMEFRKREIDSLERVFNDALVPSIQISSNLNVIARPIVFASSYLNSFYKTKLSLFNISEQDETAISIIKLKELLLLYHNKFISDKIIESTEIEDISKLCSIIIGNLQRITISNNSYI